jgi:HD superfamily phosphohydrolase YqeK
MRVSGDLGERILEDVQWNAWMEEIGNFDSDDAKEFMCDHGRGHTMRVREYAQDFLTQVKAQRNELELAEVACLLHDIGNVRGREGHAKYSEEMAREYLSKFGMSGEDIEVVAQAIGDHSGGKNMRTLVGAALILGDKLDVSCERLTPGVELNELCEELRKLKKITYTVGDEIATLNYEVEGEFDTSLLRFWWKCLSVPEMVAGFVGRGFRFTINGVEQDVEGMKKAVEEPIWVS